MRKVLVALLVIGLALAFGWWTGSQPHLDAVADARERTGLDLEQRLVPVGNRVQLHVVEAGAKDGPPVVLLHGFPEFWYAWRDVMPSLVAAGYRVIAPDQRGYGDSSKPDDVAAYGVDRLGDDVWRLIVELGYENACVVGHDWGGGVAWNVAIRHPQVVRRLVVLDTPHPDASRVLESKEEKIAWYRTVFQIPFVPEYVSRLGGWRLVTGMLRDTSEAGAFPEDKLAQYRSAWDRDGAYGKMVNWYRANTGPRETDTPPRRVSIPTLVLVAPKDAFIPSDLTHASAQLLDAGRVDELPTGTHWVIQEQPDLIAAKIAEFCAIGLSGGGGETGTEAADASLARGDEVFLEAYQAAADHALAELPLAILDLGSELVVIEHGERTASFPYLPQEYTRLKDVAHIGLAAWAMLEAADGEPVTGNVELHRVRRVRHRAAVITQMLPGAGFAPEELPRQMEILESSIAILDRVLRGERISAAEREAFARKVIVPQLANAAGATRAQLVALNETMTKILANTTAEQRARLHVVVSGVHQAREDNAAMQYYRRVLQEPGPVEKRLLYSESVFDEKGALTLLADHLVDVAIGEQFFGEERRMQRDLLGPAAAEILPTLQIPMAPAGP